MTEPSGTPAGSSALPNPAAESGAGVSLPNVCERCGCGQGVELECLFQYRRSVPDTRIARQANGHYPGCTYSRVGRLGCRGDMCQPYRDVITPLGRLLGQRFFFQPHSVVSRYSWLCRRCTRNRKATVRRLERRADAVLAVAAAVKSLRQVIREAA